jgi:trehalose 6-phosphate phosphatase
VPDLDAPADGAALRAALRDALADPGRRPLLVALDFDGTLAPLQDDPDASRVLPGAVAALRALAGHPEAVRIALVSGRPVGDLRRLADVPTGTVLIGSHGAERGLVADEGVDTGAVALTDEQRDRLDRLGAELRAVAEGRAGVWVESKPAAAVVHTRTADAATAEAAEAAALEVGARLGSAVLHGKKVVEVSVLDADKGTALVALRDELGAGCVLCAGDDVTDEHAFAAVGPDGLTLKVGPGDTAARFRVAEPEDVADLLADLADLVRATAA